MTAHTKDELDIRFSPDKKHEHSIEELKNLPPLFGGDGRSIDTPIFINCDSAALAIRHIKKFISDIYGKEGSQWKIVKRARLFSPPSPNSHIDCFSVAPLNGNTQEFYFDFSRIHGHWMHLIRQAYELRYLNDTASQADTMQ